MSLSSQGLTPIEKAKITLDYLRSDGVLTPAHADRFAEYVDEIMRQERARWDALPLVQATAWTVKATIRGWAGLETEMPWVRTFTL